VQTEIDIGMILADGRRPLYGLGYRLRLALIRNGADDAPAVHELALAPFDGRSVHVTDPLHWWAFVVGVDFTTLKDVRTGRNGITATVFHMGCVANSCFELLAGIVKGKARLRPTHPHQTAMR